MGGGSAIEVERKGQVLLWGFAYLCKKYSVHDGIRGGGREREGNTPVGTFSVSGAVVRGLALGRYCFAWAIFCFPRYVPTVDWQKWRMFCFFVLKGEEGVNLVTCPPPSPRTLLCGWAILSAFRWAKEKWIGGLSVMCKEPKPKPDVSWQRPSSRQLS